jgi:hypothetical protein
MENIWRNDRTWFIFRKKRMSAKAGFSSKKTSRWGSLFKDEISQFHLSPPVTRSLMVEILGCCFVRMLGGPSEASCSSRGIGTGPTPAHLAQIAVRGMVPWPENWKARFELSRVPLYLWPINRCQVCEGEGTSILVVEVVSSTRLIKTC